MGLVLTEKTIDKYFGFLRSLDNESKKRLINILKDILKNKKESKINLKDLSGAWEDSKNSDEIIKEIRNSRVEKKDHIEF